MVVVGAALLVGIGVAAGATLLLEGGGKQAFLAATAVFASGLGALLPMAVDRRTTLFRWGTLAFVGTIVQPGLAAGIGLGLDVALEIAPAKPFWVGCLTGAMVILVVQVSWAVKVLSRAQREIGPAAEHAEVA